MSEQPQRQAFSRRRKLLYVALVLAVFLGFTELALVFLVGEARISHRPSDGGVLVPFVPGSRAELVGDEFHVDYQINEDGFRDRRRSYASQRPRLVLLGDSFSEGWGVERRERYSDLCEAALDVELWNRARHGGNPLWYVVQLRAELARAVPLGVIVQIFDNDLWDLRVYQRRFRFAEDGRLLGEAEPSGPPSAVATFFEQRQLSIVWRRFRRLVKGRVRLHREPFYWPGSKARSAPPQRGELEEARPIDLRDWDRSPFLGMRKAGQEGSWSASFDLEGRLLSQLIDMARDAKVRLWLLYIPDRGVLVGRPELGRARAENPHYGALAALCRSKGVPLLDAQAWLLRAERPERMYFHVDGHLNAAGHALVAEGLIDALRGQLGE